MTDYNELLDRAIEQLPKKVAETTRFNVPNAYSYDPRKQNHDTKLHRGNRRT